MLELGEGRLSHLSLPASLGYAMHAHKGAYTDLPSIKVVPGTFAYASIEPAVPGPFANSTIETTIPCAFIFFDVV